jgi:hypothetical protein
MKLSTGQRISRYDYLVYTFIFFVISLIWIQLSNYTWDDDAITRYMNVQDAGNNVKQFLSGWNRPCLYCFFIYRYSFLEE